jgi:N-hydroxyarylamine O-acetyltransferase
VGLGDGSLDPFVLRAGPFSVEGYRFGLARLDRMWWRFQNHDQSNARSFDFIPEPTLPGVLAAHCEWQQTAPESTFVLNLVVQRFTGDEILQLHGRVLRALRPDSRRERVLDSADDLVRVLSRQFGLDVPEAASLWPRIVARHHEVFEAPALSAIRKPMRVTSTAPRRAASGRLRPPAEAPVEPAPQRR